MTTIEIQSAEAVTAAEPGTTQPATEAAPRHLATPAETAEQLVTAERHAMELTARVLALETLLSDTQSALETANGQIIDGSDPRLEMFWERAGRIADNADFCEEYDRMADAMNGPRRLREFEVTAQIEVTINVTRTIEARNANEARDEVTGGYFESSDLIDHISSDGVDSWELIDVSTVES